jgi:hypothetical protein
MTSVWEAVAPWGQEHLPSSGESGTPPRPRACLPHRDNPAWEVTSRKAPRSRSFPLHALPHRSNSSSHTELLPSVSMAAQLTVGHLTNRQPAVGATPRPDHLMDCMMAVAGWRQKQETAVRREPACGRAPQCRAAASKRSEMRCLQVPLPGLPCCASPGLSCRVGQ